jgi:hypothetical protein
MIMAQINPLQGYDLIVNLKFAEPEGDCYVYLHRGSFATASGTVYYRYGDSAKWKELTVKSDKTIIPVSDYVMQVGLNWDKDGDDYTTPSFRNNPNLTEITFSQKSILQGRIGNYFFYFFAYNCPNLVALDVPDISGVTEVGGYFMVAYAQQCFSLPYLPAPDTSNIAEVGDYFLGSYALDCRRLQSLSIPNTSKITSAGEGFLSSYARECFGLTSLDAPNVSNLTSAGEGFMGAYAFRCLNLVKLEIPNTTKMMFKGEEYFTDYAKGCDSLSKLILPSQDYEFNYPTDLGLSEDKLSNLMNKAKKESGE